MSFDPDDELLQDFLLEGGEILEGLSEQLVDLESDPANSDLLNAVFRGFHTIKGGAGFLALDQLVAISHIAEDVFDMLRQGSLELDPALMDVFLQVLDVLNGMFDTLRDGALPEPAAESLLAVLGAYKSGGVSAQDAPAPAAAEVPTAEVEQSAEQPVAEPVQAPASEVTAQPDKTDDEITEAEFDALLDELHGPVPGAAAASEAPPAEAVASAGNEDITEAEFDALLDELHGPGGPTRAKSPDEDTHGVAADNLTAQSDEIAEEEFEALLDELHGKGQAPTSTGAAESSQDDEAAGEQFRKSNLGEKTISGEAFNELVRAHESRAEAQAETLAADTQTAAEPASAGTTKTETASAPAEAPTGNGDEITEQEFDALLDELHGKGAPVAPVSATPAQAEQAGSAPATSSAPEKAAKPAPGKPAEKPPAPARRSQSAAKERKASTGETTVRVETETLDRIMNMVGELVLIRNRLSNLEAEVANDDVTKTVAALDLVTADLQSAAMQTRMQPIKKVFGRFPRVVRDLARSLDKDINLEMEGEDTDLDKNLVEALADPLVHLVRNAVDHGIELPDERVAAGKPRAGTLRLAAAQEGDHILLTIADDGGGMDADVLRAKAVEKGLLDQAAAARLDDSECFGLIFGAGFSTKTEISDVSGRGVGMDVVKTRINQLNGVITIDSKLGEGTTIYIKVPLTLAIMPTLMIVLGKQIFALPLVSVREIIDYDFAESTNVDGQRTMVLRGRAVPLFTPSNWLVRERGEAGGGRGNVVIVSIGTQLIGLQVDQLLGREEVVIKPLGALLQGTRGLAGATITGEGRIALIIDLPDLVSTYGGRP